MIHDLDATVSAWLSAVVPYAAVTFDAPDRVVDRGVDDRPTVTLTLLDVHEDQEASALGWMDVRSADGVATGRTPPRRQYRFTYLVSAVAQDVGSEHGVLGAVLAGTAAISVIPEEHLRGTLTECARQITVRCAPDRPDREHRDRWLPWSTAGGRTALEMDILAPMPAAAVHEVAAPPSQMELRSSRRPPDPPADRQPVDHDSPRRPISRISEL